ncbi:MAG: hypothetical protein NC429_04990 [Lachnospiraceae bacterium]|nr:hypothetical protein [Lachnospiraceae bacterium]
MSKNFAEEYKALADEELPDLWNRIEAGLTPKTTAPAESSRSSKGKVITFFRRYRTVVAAAVCVLVILPAIAVIGRTGQKNSSGGAARDSAAPAEGEFETAELHDEEPAEGEFETAELYDEEPAEDEFKSAELYNEAPAEEPASAEMWSGEDGGTAGAGGVDTTKAESADVAEDTAGVLEAPEHSESKKMDLQGDRSSSASMSDSLAKTYEKVTIKILDRMEEIETDEGFYYGMMAEIIRSSYGELPEDTQITIWVSASSSMAYILGEEYEMDLSYDSGRECPYQVEQNYFS